MGEDFFIFRVVVVAWEVGGFLSVEFWFVGSVFEVLLVLFLWFFSFLFVDIG